MGRKWSYFKSRIAARQTPSTYERPHGRAKRQTPSMGGELLLFYEIQVHYPENATLVNLGTVSAYKYQFEDWSMDTVQKCHSIHHGAIGDRVGMK